jgi:membrane protease YdiL (CAAX protease family)
MAVESAMSANEVTLARVAISAAAELVIAAALLVYLGNASLATIFGGSVGIASQIGLGTAIGAMLAGAQVALLRRFAEWRAFSRNAIEGTELGVRDIVAISVVVGIAEEALFRAALQPLLGLWAASLLFAVVHVNYASLRGHGASRLLPLLALSTVFVLGLCLGIVFERLGLAAAIATHATYDMLVLFAYRSLFGWSK